MFDGEALAILDAVAVSSSVNALVKTLGMSKPTVISKIRRMENMGLVTITERKLEHRPGRPFKIIKTTERGSEIIRLARDAELDELKASFRGEITLGIPESLAHYGVDMLVDRPSVVVPARPKEKLSLIRSYIYDDRDFYERSMPARYDLPVPKVEDLVLCMLKSRFDRLKVIPALMAQHVEGFDFSYLCSKARSQDVLGPTKFFLSAAARLNPKVRRTVTSSASMRSCVNFSSLSRGRHGLPSFGEIRETYNMYVGA